MPNNQNNPSRKTFGKLRRTRAKAQSAMNLALNAGWIDPEIEEVKLAGETFYKVTAYPIFKRIQQMFGTAPNVSNPISENPKFRHSSRYRHRG